MKAVLRENVLALIQRKDSGGPLRPGQTGVSRLQEIGIAGGSAQRVLDDTTSIGIKQVAALAERLQVEPWQLLVPSLDVDQLPGLTVDNTAWPLPMVDRKAYYRLVEKDRAYVQGAMANAITERARPGSQITAGDRLEAFVEGALATSARKPSKRKTGGESPAVASPSHGPKPGS